MPLTRPTVDVVASTHRRYAAEGLDIRKIPPTEPVCALLCWKKDKEEELYMRSWLMIMEVEAFYELYLRNQSQC